MTTRDIEQIQSGEVLDEHIEVTIVELCRSCAVQAETVEAMVEQGVLEPSGKRGHHWCFPVTAIRRAQIATRLQRDLGVNLAGAALALELLERIDRLDARLSAMMPRGTES